MSPTWTLLTWALLPSGAFSGPYSFGQDGVLLAGQANFEDLVVYSGQLTLVLFYSPSCPYCVKLEPEFKSAARNLGREQVRAVAVDAVQERGLADYYNVSGYPTLKLFVPSETATSHAGKEGIPVDVGGVGGKGALVKAACEQKQLMSERALRSKPAGGSKIVPEADSHDEVHAILTLAHPTTLKAKVAVLYLAGGAGVSPVCKLVTGGGAPPGWLTAAALTYKQGREKAVSWAAVPPSLARAVAEDFGLDSRGAPLPALLFVRTKARSRGRTAGASLFPGSLEVGAAQKKTALLRAVRSFVDRAVRGDDPLQIALPPGIQPEEEPEADGLAQAPSALWVPPELSSTAVLRSACYEPRGVCVLLLCDDDSSSAAACRSARAAYSELANKFAKERLNFATLDVAHTAATAAAAAAEKAAATGARKGMAPDEVEAAIRTAEAAARGGVSAFVDAFGARGAAAKDGGGGGGDGGGVHLVAIKTGKRPRYAVISPGDGVAAAAATGAWQRGVLRHFYRAAGVDQTPAELAQLFRADRPEASAAPPRGEAGAEEQLAPMTPAQFEGVCAALAAKHPTLSEPLVL